MCWPKLLEKFTIFMILHQIVFSAPVILESPHKFFIDYTENTEFIKERTGNDIKLECNLDGLVDNNHLSHIKVQWFFKQCSDSKYKGIRDCQDAYDSDWTQFPCEQPFCQKNLILRNVTEKYSGFYKCAVQPYYLDESHKLDIKLVRTFQLDIKNASLISPDFVGDYLKNKTAFEGTQVVMQCRVHSDDHPTIRWFKRCTSESKSENNVKNPAHVQYNGFDYELLNTAREKLVEENIYLSKLILNDVRHEDEGFFACAAISYRGYNMREAYLQVKTPIWNEAAEVEAHTDKSEFWLLFLMPVGLAVLPLSFWISYCIYKRFYTKNQLRKWSLQCSNEDTGVEHYILSS